MKDCIVRQPRFSKQKRGFIFSNTHSLTSCSRLTPLYSSYQRQGVIRPMKQTIAFTQAWSRPYIPTGGAEKVYLLIESRGTKGEKSKDRAAEVKIDKSLNSRI
jgi:hypothetical protein